MIVITDWSLPRERLLGQLERALAPGPEVAVQHRHPGAPIRSFLEEARALRELCARRGNPLFVNGRLDVALLVGAHLHLPAGGLVPADVRAALPSGTLISAAVHDEAEAATSAGADLALVSPVFSAGSKPDDRRPALGPEGFGALARLLSCPAFALGGLTPERATGVRGAAGVAAISAVLQAEEAEGAARALLAALAPRPGGMPQ